MLKEHFIFWLQGYFELANPHHIDEKGVELIRKHLALVFVHDIDPSEGNKAMQEVLNELHNKKQPEPASGNHKYPSGDGKTYRC